MTDITVISVLHKDYGTFDYMIQTAVATSNNIKQILVYDNGNNSLKNKYTNITFFDGANDSDDISTNHARGLNFLLSKVDTDVVAIIEPDVILLDKGWDELPNNVDLRACKKGVSTYYYPCFMVGQTQKLNKIDFCPSGEYKHFGGTKVYQDTGWRVSEMGLKVEELEHKNCVTGNCAIIPNKIFRKRTNEFWLNNKPIAAHLWRGSRPNGMGDDHDNYLKIWKDTAEKVLKNLKEKG